MDNQIKIRGFRVELDEIEKILLEIERNIGKCYIMFDNSNNKNIILAFITLIDSTKNLSVTSLKSKLSKKIPYYMIPQKIIIVDQIPLNINGKIDKHILKTIMTNNISQINNLDKLTDVEYKIIGILAKILKINITYIDVNADFFELGGDSLDAIRAVVEIDNEFGVNLSISTLFEFRTVKLISLLIQSYEHVLKTNKVRNNNGNNTFLLPATQKRLLSSIQKNSQNNVLYALQSNILIDEKLIFNTIYLLMLRHDILTMNIKYRKHNHYLFQKLKFDMFNFLNFQQIKVNNTILELNNILLNLSNCIIDIQKDPLFKFYQININSNYSVIVFYFNHLIVDRDSIRIIIRDFFQILFHLYDSDLKVSYPNKNSSFNDWYTEASINLIEKIFQYTIKKEENVIDNQYSCQHYLTKSPINDVFYKEQECFWLAQLLNKKRNLPFQCSDKTSDIIKFEVFGIDIDAITTVCKKNSTTVFVFFISLIQIILQKKFLINQFAIGFILSKNSINGSENIAVPTSNVSVIMFDEDVSTNFSCLLKTNMNHMKNIYANSDIQIYHINKLIKQNECLEEQAELFDIFFDYENENLAYRYGNLLFNKIDIPNTHLMKRYLSFTVRIDAKKIFLITRYRKNVFTSEDIKEINNLFHNVLINFQ